MWSREEEKERLQWEGLAEKEGFKSGIKEWWKNNKYDCYRLQCFDAAGWRGGGAAVVICLELGTDAYGPADATTTHCLLRQQNPDWFYLSGTGSPGKSRKKGR